MKHFPILFFNVLFLSLSLSSPIQDKRKNEKQILETAVTTPNASGVNPTENINKEKVDDSRELKMEKTASKKRDVPKVLEDKPEYLEDEFYDAKSAVDNYDNIQALRSYLDDSTGGNFIMEPSRLRVNDLRYYDGESRRKRTAVIDELFSKPNSYYEPEFQMTPEDALALASYRQQPRFYNLPYSNWNDVENPTDLQQKDFHAVNDDFYDDGRERSFDRFYDQKLNYWANPPRNEKFIFNRRVRNFLRNPKLRVPVYQRAIL